MQKYFIVKIEESTIPSCLNVHLSFAGNMGTRVLLSYTSIDASIRAIKQSIADIRKAAFLAMQRAPEWIYVKCEDCGGDYWILNPSEQLMATTCPYCQRRAVIGRVMVEVVS